MEQNSNTIPSEKLLKIQHLILEHYHIQKIQIIIVVLILKTKKGNIHQIILMIGIIIKE